MTRKVIALALLFMGAGAFAEDRFGRPVVKVRDSKKYVFITTDDIKYPTLSDERFSVSCLVFRGTEHYYVEVNVKNKTTESVPLQSSFISFDKSGYTVSQGDTVAIAKEAAGAGDFHFVPTVAPYIPPTYSTTINATVATYGNQTNISGTETTTPNYSGQAGANLGNAIGNAIASRRFYKAQRNDLELSRFLLEHAQTSTDLPLPSGSSRLVAATFDQMKRKKKPFTVTLRLGTDVFTFEYKE